MGTCTGIGLDIPWEAVLLKGWLDVCGLRFEFGVEKADRRGSVGIGFIECME